MSYAETDERRNAVEKRNKANAAYLETVAQVARFTAAMIIRCPPTLY